LVRSPCRYGLVTYAQGGVQAESRSTSPREVLPLIYELTGVAADPSAGTDYPGYPTVADASLAAPWFYGVLPALLALVWWRSRRPARDFPTHATGELP